jgi:hypothetical protein
MGDIVEGNGPLNSELLEDGPVIRMGTNVYVSKPYQFFESNAMQDTTEETYQEVMSRVTAALVAGTYVVSWRYEIRLNLTGALDSRAQARFLIDGAVKGNSRAQDSEWDERSGWDRYVATVGETPDLSLEIRRDPGLGGNDTVEIRKMRLGIELKG